MNQDIELSRLERFVEKMMKRFSELRDENAQLFRDIRERDLIIEELRGSISTKESERGEVSQRVSRIVEQIEEWEKSLEDEPARDVMTQDTTSGDSVDSIDVVDDLEDDARVQHNLFTVAGSEG